MSYRYALYPGCAAQGATPELYTSTMAVLPRLGITVVELQAASCCGAGVVAEADPEVALTLNARTFAQAEALNLDVMTICGTCQGVMSAANRRLKQEPSTLARINEQLSRDGLSYRGSIQVKHLLWILVKDVGLSRLREEIRMPLADLRLAPFYGCYILRPSWELGFEDPENPSSLEKVIRAVGSEAVSYAGRTKCCGFPVILEKEAIAMAMSGQNLSQASEAGAHALVTPCPLCHMSLDVYQERAGKAVGAALNLPILHLPQLLGLAMGIAPKDLGLHRHVVSVESILGRARNRASSAAPTSEPAPADPLART